MKKILLLLLCLVSLSVMGQGIIERPKCKTCGNYISQCQYNGKHPAKPQPEKKCPTCGNVLSKCYYKGKHPAPVKEEKCKECGKVLSKCDYYGKHPAPEAAGYDVTFSCNVNTANLFVDDVAYGVVSKSCFLKTGTHKVKVVAQGYEDYSSSITVNRQNTSFSVSMTKKPEPPKPAAPTKGTLNGHEWVDLGLSVKWATCNVGASKPEEYGDYFAWGETATKKKYDWSHYKWNSKTGLTKYCYLSSYGTVDKKSTLDNSDDAAIVNWGGSWRMPRGLEQVELKNRCTWTWTTMNGVNGYKVVSKINGNYIFLPAAGYRYDSTLRDAGYAGYYWEVYLDGSRPSYASLYRIDSDGLDYDRENRYYGYSIRAVCP